MTNYYVRKTGNDTTGDGSTGTPWLTLAKALTTVSIAGNHTVYIGAGTYTEDMDYPHCVYCGRVFLAPVTLRSESGNIADVIVTSPGGGYTVLYEDGASNVFWQDVTIQATGTPAQGTIRFQGACAAAGFTNCAIYSHNANGAIYASNAKTQTIAVTNCVLARRPDLSTDTRAIYVRPTGGTGICNVTLTDCTVSGNNYVGAYFVSNSGTDTFNVTISGGTYTSSGNFASGAYAILATGGTVAISNITATRDATPTVVLGSDSSTALVTTGTLSGSTISSGTSHALLVGYLAAIAVSNCVVSGGDYGVVVKMNDGTTLDHCTISGGSTASVFFKGSLNGGLSNSVIRNTTGALIYVDVGDSGQKSQDLQIDHNTLFSSGDAKLFSWRDSVGDAGGSVCDYNVYRPQGSGLFGDVYGSSGLTSLSTLRSAWLSYDVPSNDSHSRIFDYSGAINQVGRKMEFPRVGIRI